jgi:MarR family transcriptional regulator, temperature-dependent positive regulator of motility
MATKKLTVRNRPSAVVIVALKGACDMRRHSGPETPMSAATPSDPAVGTPEEFAEAYAIVESVVYDGAGPSLGLRLHGANLRNLAHFHERVGWNDISVTMLAILSMLDRLPGLSQSDLARMIKVERMTAGINVKRCVHKGLVVRETVAGDRRRYALRLTEAGREELRAIRKRIPLHESRLAQRLTTAERLQLIALLDKVGHD